MPNIAYSPEENGISERLKFDAHECSSGGAQNSEIVLKIGHVPSLMRWTNTISSHTQQTWKSPNEI